MTWIYPLPELPAAVMESPRKTMRSPFFRTMGAGSAQNTGAANATKRRLPAAKRIMLRLQNERKGRGVAYELKRRGNRLKAEARQKGRTGLSVVRYARYILYPSSF